MVAISRVGSNMRFSCFSGPIRKQVLWENNKKSRWIKLSKQVCYSCGCQTSRGKTSHPQRITFEQYRSLS